MDNNIRSARYFESTSSIHDLKRKALRSSGAMILSRSASTLIQLVGTLLIARLLTPQDFGLTAMVTSISLLLTNVGYVGFIEAIIQTERIDHQLISALFWIGLVISLGLAIAFSMFSPLLAKFYHEPRLVSIAIAFSVGFIFTALTTEHLALIMRRMEFGKVVFNEIVANAVSAGLAVAMALWGYGYWALVARHLSWAMTNALLVWIQCPWRPGLFSRTRRTRPLIKFAASTFGNYGINYFGRNLDKVLIGWKWGSQELGHYDRASQLFVMPVGQLITPLTNVALATLSRVRSEREKCRRYFLKSLSIIAFVGMYVSVILTVSGQDLIVFLLGPQWEEAGKIFTAFGPSIGITLIYGTHSWLHLSLGTPDRYLKWSLAALAATSLMFLIGLPFKGLGIAVAYGASIYLLCGPGLGYAGKPIGIRVKDIWLVLWKYIVASLISGALVWLASIKGLFIGLYAGGPHMALRIAASCLACSILYLITVLSLFRSTQPIRDLVMVIREATSKQVPLSADTEERGKKGSSR